MSTPVFSVEGSPDTGPYAASAYSTALTLDPTVSCLIGCRIKGDETPTYNSVAFTPLTNYGTKQQLYYLLGPSTGASYNYTQTNSYAMRKWTIAVMAFKYAARVSTVALGDYDSATAPASISLSDTRGLVVGYGVCESGIGGCSVPNISGDTAVTVVGSCYADDEQCYGNGYVQIQTFTMPSTGGNCAISNSGANSPMITALDLRGAPSGNQVIWMMFRHTYDRYRDALLGLQRRPFDWRDLYRRSYRDALSYAPKPLLAGIYQISGG